MDALVEAEACARSAVWIAWASGSPSCDRTRALPWSLCRVSLKTAYIYFCFSLNSSLSAAELGTYLVSRISATSCTCAWALVSIYQESHCLSSLRVRKCDGSLLVPCRKFLMGSLNNSDADVDQTGTVVAGAYCDGLTLNSSNSSEVTEAQSCIDSGFPVQ